MALIVVQEPDPAWPRIATDLMAELTSALPIGWERIEHVGSTSVPGLATKPVIDIMSATPDLDAVINVENDVLAQLGYVRAETGMIGQLFYRRDPGTPPAAGVGVHLHIVPTDTWDTRNERVLRDHLRAHPDDARRYSDLKRRLAAGMDDPLAYTRAKTALIQEFVDQARADRGLPLVDVWNG